jgi:hypothetical protein
VTPFTNPTDLSELNDAKMNWQYLRNRVNLVRSA